MDHVAAAAVQDGAQVIERALKVHVGYVSVPMVLRLRDGRICIPYGDRRKLRICARLSEDGGKTWGPERILRTGPERYIAATIWDPS